MSRLVRWSDANARNTTIPRLAPAYWTLDFNLDMVATVVTTAANAVRVKAVFRTNLDLAGLIWAIEDTVDHGEFKYPRRKDWRGCVVEFDWASSGIRSMERLQSVTLTVDCYDGKTYFVRPWNYKTSGTPDACHVAFTCDETTKAGYSADETVPWHDVKRLFISLQPTAAGRGNCTLAADLAAGAVTADINVGDAGAVKPGAKLYILGASTIGVVTSTTAGAVQTVTFTPPLVTPNGATIPGGGECYIQPAAVDVEPIGESAAQVDITDLTVSGPNSTLPIRDTPMAVNGLAMTDGYDNAYPLTPERIVEQVWNLGYRDRYVLYMGISKFHSMTWDAGEGRYIVDPGLPTLNDPTQQWLTDFFDRLHAKGFEIIVSMSFEILNRYIPSAWKQRDKDGNEAKTGWNPPSSLIAPTVAPALDYVRDVFLSVLAELPVGAAKHFQIGEPTWWGGFFSNHAPYIYDATTEAAYVAAVGPVPTPRLATVFGQPNVIHAPYIAFCRDKLGAATTYIRNQVLATHPTATTYLLVFTPQLLDHAAPMLWTLNFPIADWSAGQYDRLQIEDYDFIIAQDFDRLDETWNLATNVLGYDLADIEYFVGFNLLPSTTWVWEGTDYAVWRALPRGASRIYVWSREQVMRDGWVYDRQVQMLYPDLTTLAQCLRIERADGAIEGFTSHDRPLTVAGVTYSPANSFRASALSSDTEMSAGDVEVAGAIDADGISAIDLLAGAYDGAKLQFFLVDWADLTLPRRIVKKGQVGTVRQMGGGGFTAELRGLGQRIQGAVIEAYTPECAVDLYSAACTIDRAAHTVVSAVTAIDDGTLGAVSDRQLFFAAGLSAANVDTIFDYGEVLWTSGANDGQKVEIKSYLQAGGRVELWEPMGYEIAVGDTFEIYSGCDKRRETCFAKFANIVNFRGFPDVPGMDAILKYPDAKTG
jgi:uncharacterized phage protein (TIGR02218 family)